ncbi:FAD-dependent oxidoreductase [Corynebacterium heidelbergense]|uniref:Cholesterol oxidase n=1 Tax=Corynebacterium heidelbergense TaxID=2055947 RepID=A0A364VAA4_9CORY|nr:GMC family oxidoreductase [Corynebacterium heidelbergense]RAV33582.1 cholesterol oxidase [Corynebacterium heidelbergense]WCZ36276.1 Cholesterol oxidase [Corynebacterium heidelbergense]
MATQRPDSSPSAHSGADAPTHFDVIVVGSGFGGSVTALRLTEKGYSVGVLEAGRRFADKDFAKNSWHLKDFLWAPQLGMFGIQRIHLLNNVMILAGAGVGGGSLNYANTLYKPERDYFEDRQWAHITDWSAELEPYYDQARRMLGVVQNPTMTPADKLSKRVAEKMGVGHTFRLAPVGVFFGAKAGLKGEPGQTVSDPYFGGVGPDRTACHECGECMTGCRHGAKNTLLKNYLYLAERGGAKVFDRTSVTELKPQADGSWEVHTRRTGPSLPWGQRPSRIFTADHVVVAAGAWGTQNLLHRQKHNGNLAHLSDALGTMTRTNSEALLGANVEHVDPNNDYSEGVAITSSYFPAPDTHIEPVRYGKGSNSMALLQTLMTDGDKLRPRFLEFLRQVALQRKDIPRLFKLNKWSQRTVINLVMQTRDNSLTTYLKRIGPFRVLLSRQGTGEPNPSWIKEGNDATRHLAALMNNGIAGGTWGEVFDIPLTAHFLGGCAISSSPDHGVVDPYHRAWGYPTLHITDGSAISANPGVNPSLSITANAERAAAMWPNKGEVDPRPAQQLPYQRIEPVAPKHPVVPTSAPGALRLPITPVRV